MSPEALTRASNPRPAHKAPKTLLVHPFNQADKRKNYLLELPKDLKRKTPLLEIPKDFSKKPKPFIEKTVNKNKIELKTAETKEQSVVTCEIETSTEPDGNTMRTTSIQTECCQSHRCCKTEVDKCCQAVKVIFAPAMMPSIFGAVPGIPYLVKQPAKTHEKVALAASKPTVGGLGGAGFGAGIAAGVGAGANAAGKVENAGANGGDVNAAGGAKGYADNAVNAGSGAGANLGAASNAYTGGDGRLAGNGQNAVKSAGVSIGAGAAAGGSAADNLPNDC